MIGLNVEEDSFIIKDHDLQFFPSEINMTVSFHSRRVLFTQIDRFVRIDWFVSLSLIVAIKSVIFCSPKAIYNDEQGQKVERRVTKSDVGEYR